MRSGFRFLGRGGWFAGAVGLGFLVGAVGVLAAPAVERAVALEMQRSIESQRWLLVRSDLAGEAERVLATLPEVSVLARTGSGAILAPDSGGEWGPDNLVVFDIRVEAEALDGRVLPGDVPGAVDLLEIGPADRLEVTRTAVNFARASALVLCVAALAGLFFGPSWAVEGRLLGHREEFALRVLMGAEPGALSIPLVAGAFGALVAGILCALLGAGAVGIPVDVWLRPAALLGLLLVSIAGALLGARVARRRLERIARSILALLLCWIAPTVDFESAHASVSRPELPSDIEEGLADPDPFPSVADFVSGADGQAGPRDSAGLAREMAVCRRALRIARIRTALSEHRALVAAARGDEAMRSLAVARRRADRHEVSRWESRCESLDRSRARWRNAKRDWRQRNPPIEGRRLPLRSAIAPDRSPARGGSALFRESLALAVGVDRTIRATAAGRVVFGGDVPGVGLVVIVDHGRRTHSVYGRIEAVGVEPGDYVDAGQALGEAEAGVFYFEVRRQGRPVDPLEWISMAPAAAPPSGAGARSVVGKSVGSS